MVEQGVNHVCSRWSYLHKVLSLSTHSGNSAHSIFLSSQRDIDQQSRTHHDSFFLLVLLSHYLFLLISGRWSAKKFCYSRGNTVNSPCQLSLRVFRKFLYPCLTSCMPCWKTPRRLVKTLSFHGFVEENGFRYTIRQNLKKKS